MPSSSASSNAQSRLAQVAGQLEPVVQVAGSSTGPRLQGKVAIITGCNSEYGIGRATACQYVLNGVRALYVCDYDSSNLPALTSELQALAAPGTAVHHRAFDASSESAVSSLVSEVLSTYSRLDIFFANAGIIGGGVALPSLDSDTFLHTLKVNAVSVFLAVKYASEAMQKTGAEKPKPGGSIIATASTAGIRSGAGPTDYSASKAAVISIVQTCAWQLAGTGVRVNAICPGLIETGMTRPVYEHARKKGTAGKIGQLNPTRRGGEPDEIARVALFLGSDEASYVNAQHWAVDGGLSGSHPVVPGKLS